MSREKKELLEIADERCKELTYELKKYKDIEKELGIDLIKIANKQQIVWYKKVCVYYDNNHQEEDRQTIIHNSIITAVNFDTKTLYIKGAKMWVSITDYGKTWALTKEELL